MRGVFVATFPALRNADFLDSFRDLGCYLVDLCGKPVNHLGRAQRRQACLDGEVRLSRIFKQLQPIIVITVVRSIAANVRRAQQQANWTGLHLELPYPGRWRRHQREFAEALAPVLLKKLMK